MKKNLFYFNNKLMEVHKYLVKLDMQWATDCLDEIQSEIDEVLWIRE